ncbi:MAG: hypothetical protein VYD19_06275, partial [Myxococcota bacterium]|nr:hypothetical protein [Myxococcota bacterium]
PFPGWTPAPEATGYEAEQRPDTPDAPDTLEQAQSYSAEAAVTVPTQAEVIAPQTPEHLPAEEEMNEAALDAQTAVEAQAQFAQGVESPLPQEVEPPLPQGVESPLPQGVESPLPQGVESPLPQGVESPLPQGVESPLPQAVEEYSEADPSLVAERAEATDSWAEASAEEAQLQVIETFHGAELLLDGADEEPAALVDAEDEEELFSSSQLIDISALGESSVKMAPLAAAVQPPPPTHFDEGPEWYIQRGGIDYGPFTRDQLIQQLYDEKIDANTEICRLDIDRRALLGEFDELNEELVKWAQIRAERAARRELIRQRQQKRRRILLSISTLCLVALSVVGALYGEELYESTLPKPTPLALERWIPSAGAKLEPLSRLEESPAQRAERIRRERIASERAARLQDARDMAREAREAQVNDLDLDNARRTGRRFDQRALSAQVNGRSGRLERCFRAEQRRRPGTSSFVVQVTVRPSGRVLNALLKGGTSDSRRCIFRALKGLKVPSFDGSNAVVSFPFDIR